MADIKVWQNDAQQLFEMNQDLASVNAAGVESDGQLAFFVGKPTTGNQWTLKKITPNELGKLVYDYLTSSNIASQLASVLGDAGTNIYTGNLDDLRRPGIYNIGTATQTNNKPFTYCTVVVYKRANVITQTAYNAFESQSVVRVYDPNSSTWKPWVRMDNFGCATLAELKAALANV